MSQHVRARGMPRDRAEERHPSEWRLAPGDSKQSGAHSTNSLEALIVTAGRVEIDIDGGATQTVSAGQSLIFAVEVGHGYRNAADRPAEFHLAVFDPIDHHSIR